MTQQSENVTQKLRKTDTEQILTAINAQCNTAHIVIDTEFLTQLKHMVDTFARFVEKIEPSVSFRSAADFSMKARAHRRPSTKADLRSYINRMCRYKNIAGTAIRNISIEECRDMLQYCFGHSKHSYRKAQSVLHSIFHHAERQGWCSTNPARAILRPPVVEKKIQILSIQQIRDLLKACRSSKALQSMEPALRLMLWCGIRPMEVRRLSWSDIDPDEKVVYIEPTNSKTGGARAVSLRGGSRPLIQQARSAKGSIAPADWERLWRKLRRQAGFDSWQSDALRHTFASMHLKHFHNLMLLQEEMGHRNSTLLQTRYLNLRNLSSGSAEHIFRAKNRE